MTKYYPEMTHNKYEQFIAEYMKDSNVDFVINTNDRTAKKGYDENGDLLFYLIPDVFDEKDFELYDIMDEVAESNLNTNRGASAGIVDRNLVGWGKKDNIEAIKNEYKQKTKYSLERTNPKNPKARYRISNPVHSNMVGYFDKADINCRKYISNPPKCRLTSFTQKNFEKYKQLIPYVEKISNKMKEYCPKQYTAHKNFLKNKEKIGDSVFTTLTINKNFRTAIHTDKGDYQNGIGVISCMGDFKGGDFCLPNYRMRIELKPQDLLFVNVHRHHCNTEIEGNRISVVSYIRENFEKCENKIDYKIIVNNNNESIFKYLEDKCDNNAIYYTAKKGQIVWNDFKEIHGDPVSHFPAYTPTLLLNEIPKVPNGMSFEEYILETFEKSFKESTPFISVGDNVFSINMPEKQKVSTLIDDRMTDSIKMNIKSWESMGYEVDIYSYIHIEDMDYIDARTICEHNEIFMFVMNLCKSVDTIFISNDTLLMKPLPKKKIIITTEFNRALDTQPNLSVFKMPKDNVFMKDCLSFFNGDTHTTENKRKFMRAIRYFALAKELCSPAEFTKIHKVYAKSIFIDYEKYKKQKLKYNIPFPLKEDLTNCIGIKTNNINQTIHKNSLFNNLHPLV
tara:strand:- start:385 stop:2247 length:1863 start_codon:yes stop_codon:yes gene_type:complete